MINKNKFFIRVIFIAIILSFCLILNSCKSCKENNEDEKITIEINNISDTLYVNEPVILTYTASKENIEVIYEVSDNSLASINDSTLTPLKEGTITITVYYKENIEIFDSVTCTIIQREPEVTEIKLGEISDTLYVNEPVNLTYTASKENIEVIYEVSDNTLASINGSTLTPLKEGTITITVYYKENTEIFDSVTCTIIQREPESLKININSSTIYMGDTINLSASVYPASASQEVTWSILDDKVDWEVAELTGTTLTALKYGKVYITAQSTSSYNAKETIIIEVLHPLLEETETYEAKYIRGAFGEDASSMYTIQYTTYNSNTFALVTTSDDPEFNNAKEYYGEGYYFEDLNELLEGQFEGRNIWRIEMTNLQSDTEYIYKINKGNDTYSDIYTFKTAGKNTPTSFLFITDTHYYTGTTGTTASAAVSEEIIKQALVKNPNISFIMDSGDLIDTGGNSKIWDIYFNCATSLKNLPFISVPGNHEYYYNGTGQGDNSYFKIFNPGPNNGPEALQGSTGWFKHNDTLFILVDNVKSTGYDEQMKWMANLLETVDYSYSVAMFHIPVNFDNTDYDEKFLNLFDKYSVDLVLTGHYHSETLTEYLYEGQKTTNPYLGTCYLTGAYSGIKGASSADNAINTAKGYMIDITDDAINIQIIYANGNLGKSWSITNRSCNDSFTATKEELKDSITYEYNETTNEIKFLWSEKFYGNVKKLYVNELNQNKISDYSVFPSSAYTSLTLKNIIPNYDYNFEITIEFTDGTKEIIYQELNLHIPLDIQFTDVTSNSAQLSFTALNDTMRFKVYKFKVYINDEYVSEFKYRQGSTFTNTYFLNDLKPNKEYKITLVATDRNDKEIYFQESATLKTLE